MASVTLRQNVATTTHPLGAPLVNDYRFLNQGAPADVKAGVAVAVADIGSIIASLGTCLTDISASITLAGTASSDLALPAVLADIQAAQTLANTGSTHAATLTTNAGSDIILSFDTTLVTKKTQLYRALDAFRHQVASGVGGLSE